MKIALFASGSGSNVAALLDAADANKLGGEVCALVCDNPDAYVLERVSARDLPVFVAAPADYDTRRQWEEAIVDFLHEQGAELIVLAGFMRIVGSVLLDAYPGRILNIHPSLLPAFPGRTGILDAYEAGVSETGVTVHQVDAGIDTGPIIAQESLTVAPEETLEELEERIHEIEHRLYPQTIREFIKSLEEES